MTDDPTKGETPRKDARQKRGVKPGTKDPAPRPPDDAAGQQGPTPASEEEQRLPEEPTGERPAPLDPAVVQPEADRPPSSAEASPADVLSPAGTATSQDTPAAQGETRAAGEVPPVEQTSAADASQPGGDDPVVRRPVTATRVPSTKAVRRRAETRRIRQGASVPPVLVLKTLDRIATLRPPPGGRPGRLAALRPPRRDEAASARCSGCFLFCSSSPSAPI